MIGRTIDNKYRLDAELGRGGMGTVYRAARLLIGDEVAVKILHAELVKDAQSAERFRREAQAAARLKHPNVVTVYDFGITDDGLVYLVMELIEGESLRDIIKRNGALPLLTAAEITRQICAALDEAHEARIVHRDMKPDNIIVRQTPQGLRVKVLDFGIAKLRDAALTANNLTQTGTVLGTPFYMSPEQCMGEEVDHRADIYSVGVILYEMLVGAVPFNSPTPTAVAVQHATQQPASPRAINMSIPAAVEAVVLHALQKRREARPQTAGALARELTDELDDATLVRQATAMPPSPQPTAPPPNANSGTMPTVVMSNPAWSSDGMPPPGASASPYRNAIPANSKRGLLLAGGGVVLGLVVACGAFMLWSGARAEKEEATGKNTTAFAENTNSADLQTPKNATAVNPLNVGSSPESKIVGEQSLSANDIAGLSAPELRRLRNTVYARHGRMFDSPELQRYFANRAWYTPSAIYNDGVLTSTDRANISLLKATEEQAGGAVSGAVSIIVTASSARPTEHGISYAPRNAMDGSLLTAWIEGSPGAGIGAWLQFDFGVVVKLRRIVIAPGYFKSPEIWAKNNRVAAATFRFSDGSSRFFRFPDVMREQTLDVGLINTSAVRIEIDDVYSNNNDPDTAISQVAFEFEP